MCLTLKNYYIIWCVVKVVGSIFFRKSPPLHLDKSHAFLFLQKVSPIIDNYTTFHKLTPCHHLIFGAIYDIIYCKYILMGVKRLWERSL